MTTTQGDRFACCENIVSRLRTISAPPPLPRPSYLHFDFNIRFIQPKETWANMGS